MVKQSLGLDIFVRWQQAGISKVQNGLKQVGQRFGRTQLEAKRFTGAMLNNGETMRILPANYRTLTMASDKFGMSSRKLAGLVDTFDMRLAQTGNLSLPLTTKNLSLFKKQNDGTFRSVNSLGGGIRAMGAPFKRMNFQMFGALFIGMALQSAFLGLFTGSKLLAGVFEAISTVIGAALLPAFLPFALVLLDLALMFLDLDENTRKSVGNFILIAGLIGGLIMIIGMLSLGFGGFIIALAIIAPFVAVWRFFNILLSKTASTGQKLWAIFSGLAGIASIFGLILLGTPVGWAIALGAALFLVLTHLKQIGGFIKNIFKFGGKFLGSIFKGVESTGGVPQGATGGIVTRPTLALIGEAGPEAVVPLSGTPGSSPLPGGGAGGISININAGMDSDSILQAVNDALSSALRGAGFR